MKLTVENFAVGSMRVFTAEIAGYLFVKNSLTGGSFRPQWQLPYRFRLKPYGVYRSAEDERGFTRF